MDYNLSQLVIMLSTATTTAQRTPQVLDMALDRVDVVHPGVASQEKARRKCRDIFDGPDAIAENADAYFEQFDDEDPESFKLRAGSAAVHPGLSQTVQGTKGMILQDGLIFQKLPESLKQLMEDVDNNGTHVDVFAGELIENAMVDGIAGILIERTQVPAGAKSPDELRKAGLRTVWIMVNAKQLIRPFYTKVKHGYVLSQLVIREEIVRIRPETTWAMQRIYQYRAYQLVRTATGELTNKVEASLYATDAFGTDPLLDPATVKILTNMTRIPWSPLRAGRKISLAETRPALLELADCVMQFHKSLTGILHIQDVACNAPTQVAVGRPPANREKLKMGVKTVQDVPSKLVTGTNQPLYWHQISVDVCEPAEHTLDRTETMMAFAIGSFLGLQPKGVETARAKELRDKGGNATLSSVARATKDCIDLAIDISGEYEGIAEDARGTVQVRTDFSDLLMGADVMLAYAALVKQGFPKRPILIQMRKLGRIAADEDLDKLETEWDQAIEAQAQLDQQNAELAAQMKQPQPGAPTGKQKPGTKTPAKKSAKKQATPTPDNNA